MLKSLESRLCEIDILQSLQNKAVILTGRLHFFCGPKLNDALTKQCKAKALARYRVR